MNLTNALNEWSNRPELASFHPDFIELTESVLNARLHERHLEAFATYGINPLGTINLLPEVIDVLGARLQVVDESHNVVNEYEVEFRPRDEVLKGNSSRPIACIVGRTMQFSVRTGQVEVRQKNRITTVNGGGTNWILTTFPNVYLFGCLVELYGHLRDSEQTSHYKTRFEEALGLANSSMVNRAPQQYAKSRAVR